MFEQVFESLAESTKYIRGAIVENNKFCVSVHYRNVDEKVCIFIEQPSLDILFNFIVCLISGRSFLFYLFTLFVFALDL